MMRVIRLAIFLFGRRKWRHSTSVMTKDRQFVYCLVQRFNKIDFLKVTHARRYFVIFVSLVLCPLPFCLRCSLSVPSLSVKKLFISLFPQMF